MAANMGFSRIYGYEKACLIPMNLNLSLPRPQFVVLDSSSCPFGRHLLDCKSRRVVTELVQSPQEVAVMDGSVSS